MVGGQALGLQACGQTAGKRLAQFLQCFWREFFDEEFHEQVANRRHQAAFLSLLRASWASTSSAHTLGAIGKPSRARLSR